MVVPATPPPPHCILEVELSVGLCGAFCFLMLFAGRETADFWAFLVCICLIDKKSSKNRQVILYFFVVVFALCGGTIKT